MSTKPLPNVPYLDAIRPDCGWHTEFAVLATYSADLGVLTAALLALAAVDDDRGSGSKVDFANAMNQLAGRVRLVVQAGRLVSAARTPRILTILDRYVREMGQDEAAGSWHPKIALCKHTGVEGVAQWRLWIGSRNLTRDLSWDVGLLLTGQTATDPAAPPANQRPAGSSAHSHRPEHSPGHLAHRPRRRRKHRHRQPGIGRGREARCHSRYRPRTD
jgi:hypothetical protein